MPRLYYKKSLGFSSRKGYDIDMIILHYTWGSFKGDLATLTSKRASSHLYIRDNGDIWWLVPFENTAFHAGINAFKAPIRAAKIKPNERSIGIEIEGYGTFTENQYLALEWCLPIVMERYDIPQNFLPNPKRGCDPKKPADRYDIESLEHFRGILAHGNIHHSKTDPGMNFNWTRLKRMLLLFDPGCLTEAETYIFRDSPESILRAEPEPGKGIQYEYRGKV